MSLCLQLKWHAAWTSNLLRFVLITDPLLQGIGVLSRKWGQTPDSSVIAAKFLAIPRGLVYIRRRNIPEVQRPAGPQAHAWCTLPACLSLCAPDARPPQRPNLAEKFSLSPSTPNSSRTYVTSSPCTVLTCLGDHNHSRKNKVKVPNTLLLPAGLPGEHVQRAALGSNT